MEGAVGRAGERVSGEATEVGEGERVVAAGRFSEGGSGETVSLLVQQNAREAGDVDKHDSGDLGGTTVGSGESLLDRGEERPHVAFRDLCESAEAVEVDCGPFRTW